MRSIIIIITALLGLLSRLVSADNVTIQTYTDNKCNTPSTSAASVSLPIEACVATIGMQSFKLNTVPCAHGGSVRTFAYSDSSCSNRWLWSTSWGGGCQGADTPGEAYGSIVLTCDQDSLSPKSFGQYLSITVGSAVAGTPVNGTAVGAATAATASPSSASGGSGSSTGDGSGSTAGDSSGSIPFLGGSGSSSSIGSSTAKEKVGGGLSRAAKFGIGFGSFGGFLTLLSIIGCICGC